MADSTQFGCDALALVAPASTELLQMAAQRGHNLGSITAALPRLLDQYGAPLLQAAMVETIMVGTGRQVMTKFLRILRAAVPAPA